MKTALTIAGSDSCGGAGVQADLKTFTILGVYGMSALTAVTAQNTLGVKKAIDIDAEMVRLQIDAVAGDIEVDATKTGMLSSVAIIEVVEDCIKRNKLSAYVCDPVMAAKSGDALLKKDAIEAMKKRLFPLSSVITPNLRETAMLTRVPVESLTNIAAAKDAARRLVDIGAKSAVVKGIESNDQMIDVYWNGHEFLEFAAKLQPKDKTHGSGCAFSAAITAGLADRMNLVEAIDQAKQLVNMAIQYGDGQGRGVSPVNVIVFAGKKK